MKHPPWTRDELILALDLYFKEPSARGSKTHPAVIELSELLNRLPIRPPIDSDATYRNPNGVGLKLSNFLQYDPDYKGVGMKHGNKLEAVVWDEFANGHDRLSQVAKAIRLNADTPQHAHTGGQQGDDEALEGRILTRVHKTRERDQGLAKKKKAKVIKSTGKLKCEVCGFDFSEKYGELGEGFAECHHTKPLSTLIPGEKTKLSDLAVVCANCHRMLHRAKPWLSIDDLKKTISDIL
ncbi:MAG: HNH endonuclease [Candidatus Thiodiazotropha sp.]